ncbi:MAG TPA: 4Fe-4S binding protein [Epulopiscium sp.]|nr:4Fe-4S binding protein [Candidatus Epulonipiscium sp.]
MKIAVLSGKGGTGKTLVSVNLAAVAKKSIYLDCDVEEPNGHFFFKPENIKEENISIKIPIVNQALCHGCRKCVDFCKFNALAYIKDKVVVFEEVCHSCGGCRIVCPQNAISEKDKVIGRIQKGKSHHVDVNTGILNIGIAAGIPIIDKLLANNRKSGADVMTFIDCPPGSACSVMESIKDADYCVLVAEPTIFGVHNLEMVYELVKLFNKPFGIVINKCLEGENLVDQFCSEKGVKILERIPYDYELGTLNSNGMIVARENEKYKRLFSNLLETVMGEVQGERTSNS